MSNLESTIILNPNNIERKAQNLQQFGVLKNIRNYYKEQQSIQNLNDYANKLESVFRPKDKPHVFVFGQQQEFELCQQQISQWQAVKSRMIRNKALSAIIKPGAVKDTFFDDNGTLFLPSLYYSIINPDQEVIRLIESYGQQALNNSGVGFDIDCYTNQKISVVDPFELPNIDQNNINQILPGDSIMYPYIDDNQLKIKVIKLIL